MTRTSRDYPGALELTDLNRDGRLDVVVAHDGWGTVGVYLQGADGGLQEEERYVGTDGSANLHGLAIGDVNGDGRPDVVQAGLSVLYNRGTPSSAPNTGMRAKAARFQPGRAWVRW